MMKDIKIRKKWTRNELILAFSFYCKTPFGKLHYRNPDIIKLAKLISRTPSSLALKLVNFSSLDPELKKRGIKGMSNYSKLDKVIFNEFHQNWENLFTESEILYEQLNQLNIQENRDELNNFNKKVGEEIVVKIKRRINQNFFRKIVLSNYNEHCAICNLNHPSLLVASHIIPWSKDKEARLNPHNGLCLCSIHDKAFDRGLISIDNELRIIISEEILKVNTIAINNYFKIFISKKINLPTKFSPSLNFLDYHRKNIFKGSL